MIELIKEVLYPSEEYTPIPFWFFNDLPDCGKIRAQLENYVEKGVHGFVLHPRIGIPKELPYLSEGYFEAVRFIVKTASELGMKVVLYDEGMYPSGSAHGMVVKQNPEYASKGIRLAMTRDDASGEIITCFADGSCLVYDFTGGTIRGIHFGEDDNEADAPKSADILNPKAVEEFLRLTHDRYYEELKEYFGNTILAFFTDEPSPLGRNAEEFRAWVPGLEKEIISLGGSLEELKGLFTDEKNTTTAIYHKLIKKYLREIFYRRLSEWCENHGIALIGHPEVSDDVEEQLYFQIPGQDLIMRRVAPETGGISEFDSVQAKLAADIARHLGRRRNANECFGVCFRDNIPWYFKAEDMKWYIDWLGIRGVNLFIPHAFYYSVVGARKEERPPDVGPNNIWWPHYKRISDYMKRLSYLMTDSVNGARVAVLCDNNQVPYKELAPLFENQIEFNYLPISLLQACSIHDGRLCIREYEYEAVLNVMDASWDKDLYAVAKEEESPTYLKIFHDAEKLVKAEIYKVITTNVPVEALRVSKLRKKGVEMYLFSNEGNKTITAEVSIPAKKLSPVTILVDLWRGEAKRRTGQKAGVLDICLQARETLLAIPIKEGEQQAEWKDMIKPEMPEFFLGDLTEQFRLVEKANNHAVYKMEYDASKVYGTECFEVNAEEMVECYCNGEWSDVGLWRPYRLRIGDKLKVGTNELRLVVTGSAANIYCDADIPYGLGV